MYKLLPLRVFAFLSYLLVSALLLRYFDNHLNVVVGRLRCPCCGIAFAPD